MIRVFPATRHDAYALIRDVRASDLHELRAAARMVGRFNYSFNMDVLAGVARGNASSFWYKDGFLGLGGIEPTDDFGVPWFIGTNLADKKIVPFTRLAS